MIDYYTTGVHVRYPWIQIQLIIYREESASIDDV